MVETICIPKERYEFLVKCERLVDLEFEEKFSKQFIEDVRKSEDAYKKGEFARVKDSKDRKKLFESM